MQKKSRSEKEVAKSKNDVVSIRDYVIKKNRKLGARHGRSERHRKYYKKLKKSFTKQVKKERHHSRILAK